MSSKTLGEEIREIVSEGFETAFTDLWEHYESEDETDSARRVREQAFRWATIGTCRQIEEAVNKTIAQAVSSAQAKGPAPQATSQTAAISIANGKVRLSLQFALADTPAALFTHNGAYLVQCVEGQRDWISEIRNAEGAVGQDSLPLTDDDDEKEWDSRALLDRLDREYADKDAAPDAHAQRSEETMPEPCAPVQKSRSRKVHADHEPGTETMEG